MGKFCAVRKISCPLLSQDLLQVPPARAQVRLLHRHRRTRLVISLQVQQHNEETIPTLKPRETEAIQQKQKRGQRSGIEKSIARSASMVKGVQRKSRRQRSASINGTQPQTLLTIQIQNLLPKWYRGSTVFFLTSRKTEIAKSARESSLRGLFAGRALAMPYFGQKTSVI